MAIPRMSEKENDEAESRMDEENQHCGHDGHSQSRFALHHPNHLANIPNQPFSDVLDT